MLHLAIVITTLTLNLMPQPALADDSGDAGLRHSAVTINPLGLLAGAIDAQIENRTSRSSALAVRADVGRWSDHDWSWGFLGVGAAYRMYPEHRALQGFSWGPGGAVSFVSGRVRDVFGNRVTTQGIVLGPSLEAGYQFILNGGFALDLGLGAVWYFGQVGATSGGVRYIAPVNGLTPFFRFGIGYAWR